MTSLIDPIPLSPTEGSHLLMLRQPVKQRFADYLSSNALYWAHQARFCRAVIAAKDKVQEKQDLNGLEWNSWLDHILNIS